MGLWTRPLAFAEHCRRRYGKRFTIRFPFTPPFVVLSDPDEIKEVFTAPPDVLHPGEGSRVLQPLVGSKSVILLDGEPHMEQRKLLLPLPRRAHGAPDGAGGAGDPRGGARLGRRPDRAAAPLGRAHLEIILRAVFGLDPGPRLDALRDQITRLLRYGESPITLIPAPTDPSGPNGS